MIDHELLNRVMEFAGKEAYAPPGAAMPPMDPMMMGGGMPPAPQGMPPAPQGMPMDPMAAGAPPGMPGMPGGGPPPDPSMVGALPPDPAAAGMAPGDPGAGAPIMLAQEDLMDLIEIAAQSQQGGGEMPEGEAGMPGMPPEAEAGGAEEDDRVTNKELAARIDTLEDTLAQISSVMGIQQPAAAAAGEALGIGTGLEPVPPEGGGALMPAPALPDGGPMMPAEAPGPEKMATAEDALLTTIRSLNSYT